MSSAALCPSCGKLHSIWDDCKGVIRSEPREYANPVLNEREHTHGDYANTATIAQELKDVIRQNPNKHMNMIQLESLDLICTKISRILSGNPNEKDHWKDIAGYANLVSERLK
jgi:hypothetical protein